MVSIRDISKLRSLELAEIKNGYLNMLTSTITHELMTPLNCILTFANTIIKRVTDGVVLGHTKMIRHSTMLMRLQVHDLLDR
jgi:signal transduction histidine kinase